jgi:4-amino-4-deoxychorismate lyase
MKYPNPFSSHVLSADILNRWIDPQSGHLHTTRLIHKTGTLPTGVMNMLHTQEAFVLEESTVDPENCFMQTRTRNLTHQRFLVAEEVLTYTKSLEDQTWTLADCQATMKCNFGSKWTKGLSAKIEGLGVKRFADHFPKSKLAMMHILDKLRNREKII